MREAVPNGIPIRSLRPHPCSPQQGLPIFPGVAKMLDNISVSCWLTRVPTAGGQVIHLCIDTNHNNPENLLELNKKKVVAEM